MSSLVAQLRDLKAAFEEGLLNEEEYQRERQAVLEASRAAATGAASLVGSTRVVDVPPEEEDTDPGRTRSPLAGGTRVVPADPEGSSPLSGSTRAHHDPLAGATRGLTVMGQAVGATEVDLRALPAGAMFDGRYTIASRIGVGGMGTVYQAVDSRVGHTIALKVLRPEVAADARLVEALSREVALAQELHHPNLLRVLHFETRGETPYVVMELMGGGDLDERLAAAGGRLDPGEVLGVLRGVLAGLGALHDKRIAHLDVKPQNVLLSPSGAVKLADFGISSRMRDQRAARLVAGTPEYAPPEQLAGASCDARADVYAVGMMAHRLLAGSFPFDAATEGAARAWHQSGERSFPRLEPAVAAVVARATAVAPDQRFRTAAELLRDFERALTRAPWFSVPGALWDRLSGRLHDEVRLPDGTLVRVDDAAGLLVRGAARPGWRTIGGRALLESHPLALTWAGLDCPPCGASEPTRTVGAKVLAGQPDGLARLPSQGPVDDAALAAAAHLAGEGDEGLRQLSEAEASATTARDHVAIAEARLMGLGSRADAEASLALASQAAGGDLEALLDVAAARWVLLDDPKRAQVRLYDAERGADQAPSALLKLACAHMALAGPSAGYERARGRLEELPAPDKAIVDEATAREEPLLSPDEAWAARLDAELVRQWDFLDAAQERRELALLDRPPKLTPREPRRYRVVATKRIEQADVKRKHAEAFDERVRMELSNRQTQGVWMRNAGVVLFPFFAFLWVVYGFTVDWDIDLGTGLGLLGSLGLLSAGLVGVGFRILGAAEKEARDAAIAHFDQQTSGAEAVPLEAVAPTGDGYESTGGKKAMAILLGFALVMGFLLCAGFLVS